MNEQQLIELQSDVRLFNKVAGKFFFYQGGVGYDKPLVRPIVFFVNRRIEAVWTDNWKSLHINNEVDFFSNCKSREEAITKIDEYCIAIHTISRSKRNYYMKKLMDLRYSKEKKLDIPDFR